jgi:hypothetical protein
MPMDAARAREGQLIHCPAYSTPLGTTPQHLVRPQTIGGGIWRVIVYRNGRPGLGAH